MLISEITFCQQTELKKKTPETQRRVTDGRRKMNSHSSKTNKNKIENNSLAS